MEVIIFSTSSGSFELVLRKGQVYSLKRVESDTLERGFNILSERIKNYFEGKKEDFSDVAVNFEGYNKNEIKVLQTVRKIPYGEVRNYLWVAEKSSFHRKWRWVGNVLSKNRIPLIIPCHRVIKSNGEIGGFTWGKEWKRKLLEIEHKSL